MFVQDAKVIVTYYNLHLDSYLNKDSDVYENCTVMLNNNGLLHIITEKGIDIYYKDYINFAIY